MPHFAEPPIFVVGTGRSGTTLLRSLLSAHTRIAVTPETHFCSIAELHTGATLDARPEQRPPDFEALWRAYLANPRFADLGTPPERVRAILERSPERSYRALLGALMTAYREREDKPRVGEKSPGHWRYVPALLAWFPEARVVVVRRDPRAFVASRLKVPWARRYARFGTTALGRLTRLHRVASEARHWARVHGEAAPRILGDPRATAVAYEDLVADPEAEMRRLCAFLGEAFEPAMLGERDGQSEPAGAWDGGGWDAWRERHHAQARGAVSAGSLERWRSELSPREVATIETLAGEAMARWGYPLASAPAARRAAKRLSSAAEALGEAELGTRRAARAALAPLRGVCDALARRQARTKT